jgi:hypothetical protein
MTQATTPLRFGFDRDRRVKQAIEGPTRKQALGMAAYRRQLLEQAAKSADADKAFEWDCEAFDLENDLVRYGFNPETGGPAR